MNKKADSRLLSPWLFIIFGVIGVGIVLGVFVFYSIGIDIRLQEAETLSNKLVMGVTDNGYLKQDVTNENILDLAGLDESKFTSSGNFYFNLSINEKFIVKGNKAFEVECGLSGKGMAKWYEEELVVLNKNNEFVKIKIKTGSNQLGSKL